MTKKVAFYGVFITLALIAGYLERLIPINIGIPGIKLGLANIVTILVLFTMSVTDAVVISLLRVILGGFMFGNFASIAYSLAGAIASLLIMFLLKRFTNLHMVTISVCGGIGHNIGQIAVAAILLGNSKIIFYLPFLLIAGVISGTLIGILSGSIIKRVPYNMKLEEDHEL